VKLRKLISLAMMMSVFLAMAGCGTLNEHVYAPLGTKSPKPYGGVRYDLYVSAQAIQMSLTSSSPLIQLVAILYPLDLPLSAIADTILLPITIYYALTDSSEDAAKQEPSTHY
jgi:uncharacterized protein YceK